jgi:hypothetical protein
MAGAGYRFVGLMVDGSLQPWQECDEDDICWNVSSYTFNNVHRERSHSSRPLSLRSKSKI